MIVAWAGDWITFQLQDPRNFRYTAQRYLIGPRVKVPGQGVREEGGICRHDLGGFDERTTPRRDRAVQRLEA